MYSLNVPVPPAVARLAGDLAAELPMARQRTRGEHTLVVKRLGRGDAAAYARTEVQAREAVAGTTPFRARVDGVGVFESPVSGPGPVVYLRVDSPGLARLHDRLVAAFEPVEGLEGADYTPHVTVARGGEPEAARRLAERSVDRIEWTVEELAFRDARRGEWVSRVSLPA